MNLARFTLGQRECYGIVVGNSVYDLSARTKTPLCDLASVIRSNPPGVLHSSPDYALSDVRLLNPCGRTRYFCIGVNYPERNEEYKDNSPKPAYPSLFMRTHSSFSHPGEAILRPRESEQLDYEGEIAVIIGHGGRRIPQATALSHIFGYSCANEGSVRDWLRHSKFNVTQGKNFDRSGSIGPWITTADEVDGRAIRVTTTVNDNVRQDDTSDRMMFSIAYIVSYLSLFCTLEPGDVILSGTPSGAGARLDPPVYLRHGDVVEVTVSGVGALKNEVVDEAE